MGPLRVKSRLSALIAMTVLCAALILPGFGPVQAATTTPNGKIEVSEAVHHDVSPPLRDIKPAASAVGTPAEVPNLVPPTAGNGPDAADPVVKAPAKGTKVGTTAGLNFDGLSAGAGGTPTYVPADTNGTVGATQYVQMTNVAFQVFNKTTGASVYGPFASNTLWSGFGGGCEANNNGDPLAQYDKAANRWVLSQFSVSNPATYHYLQCVAVSTTSDATGTYHRYAFDYGPTAFNDYGKMGIWPDGYYITYNMFNGKPDAPVSSTNQTFGGAKVCAFDRTRMLSGLTATQQCHDFGPSWAGLLPSDLDGSTPPPSGSPNYLMSWDNNHSSLDMFKMHVDWVNTANTTVTGPTNIPVAAFSPSCQGIGTRGTCVPQPGTAQMIDTLTGVPMYRLAYRNFGDHESLTFNHSVTAGSTVGERWYEIRNPNGTPLVYQQQTFGGDANYRWMGSIAMDHNGDMALGYSLSSTTTYPSIYYTGRLASDPLSTMQGENPIMSGSGSQVGQYTRWGDYSDMTVDPVDDCTFWYTTMYLPSTGLFNWHTRIASFKFPSCGAGGPPPMPTKPTVFGATYNSITWQWTESDPNAVIVFTTDGVHFYSLAAGTTNYTLYGVAYGSYACLSIAAFDNGQASGYTTYTCSYVVPIAPYNPHQTAGTTSTGTISWANYDTLSYEQVYDYSGAAWHQVGQNGTSFTLTGIPAGYYHCAAVQAYNVNFASGYSYACPFATPNAPTNIHALTQDGTSVTFTWDAPDPYSWYYVYETSPSAGHVVSGTQFTTTHLIISGAHAYACIYVAAGGYGGTSSYPYACAWAY